MPRPQVHDATVVLVDDAIAEHTDEDPDSMGFDAKVAKLLEVLMDLGDQESDGPRQVEESQADTPDRPGRIPQQELERMLEEATPTKEQQLLDAVKREQGIDVTGKGVVERRSTGRRR